MEEVPGRRGTHLGRFRDCVERCKAGTVNFARSMAGEMAPYSCRLGAKIADVSSVLGRLSFGLTALGHYRPFLGPVYVWVAAMQNFSVCRLPKAKQLIFQFLARVLDGDGRLLAVGSAKQQEVELFRTDAKAEGNTVRIAGWACCDSSSADTLQCRWFSETLDHTNAPWLFCSGESYRQIASLELAATLVAVVLFGVPETSKCARCSAATDKRGNGSVVARWLTTKFPLSAFLMELATQLQSRGADLQLHWLPRLQNIEADALTNSIFAEFTPEKRMRFEFGSFKGHILSDLLACGIELYDEIRTSRAAKMHNPCSELSKEDTLRMRAPWE